MAKTSGGVLTLKTGSREYNKRLKEVEELRANGKYSSVIFSENGGGYVAIEKSKARRDNNELAASKVLADNGYKVILKNEEGEIRTPDGYIFSTSFEQRTPTKDGANTIRNALNHARQKRANIAVIYSKEHIFTRQSVEQGLRLYEDAHRYRFNQILIVADNGRIHKHKHNK